jgi:3-phosphoshikimate 1-carboxyvinyltransferase
MNRAFVIAALRKGETMITGKSNAGDVLHLLSALRALDCIIEETESGYHVSPDFFHMQENREREVEIECGDGGTTFRFLLALACIRSATTTLMVSPQLFARPHLALIQALETTGAKIERFEEAGRCGYRVTGWSVFPNTFEIDATESSQFASALALLSAASSKPFSLRLKGGLVSAEYFEMTLRFLRNAGVDILREKDLLVFNPTAGDEKLELHTSTDASSIAVWKVAQFAGSTIKLIRPIGSSNQPDTKIDYYLSQLTNGAENQEIVFDLSDTPDLLPVLTVAALYKNSDLRCTGVGHLRFKESNRLEDFAASLRTIGADCEVRDSEFILRASRLELLSGRTFDTHGDHRLVMAGALLAMLCGSVIVTEPYAVTKSYPAFWDDARRAGFHVQGV